MRFLVKFILIVALIMSLVGGTYIIGDKISSIANGPDLIPIFDTLSSVGIKSYPTYTPSQSSDFLERISYFFTDFVPSLYNYTIVILKSIVIIVIVPLINIGIMSFWVMQFLGFV